MKIVDDGVRVAASDVANFLSARRPFHDHCGLAGRREAGRRRGWRRSACLKAIQFPRMGSERIRTRPRAIVTSAPAFSSSVAAGRFAASRAAC